MPKHAKITNSHAADHHVFAVAVQSNKVYAPPLSACAFAGIAARQINAIRLTSQCTVCNILLEIC